MNEGGVQEILDPNDYLKKLKPASGSIADVKGPYPKPTKTDSQSPRRLVTLQKLKHRVSSTYDDETSTENDTMSHT